MTFLDTSYFVALALPRDALHRRALAWSACLAGPFLTTEYVLWEFVNRLSHPINRPKAHATLRTIQTHPAIRTISPTLELFASGM